jgi:hypothetical protein
MFAAPGKTSRLQALPLHVDGRSLYQKTDLHDFGLREVAKSFEAGIFL